MPRITYVKKAQPRFATKPVLDEAGNPIKIPLTKNGRPKTDKRGRVITITKTVRDLERPLPPLKCDYAGCKFPDKEIRPGMPYKHMSPRSGPFGGRQINRHEECPNWNTWDYSSSLSAMVDRVVSEGSDLINSSALESEDDFNDVRDQLTEMAGELRDEKSDNLSNLPESFQQSGELYEQVEALESWVGEIEGASCPDGLDTSCGECSGSGEVDCDDCGGTGTDPDSEDEDNCEACGGSGTVDCEECGGTGEVEVPEEKIEEARQVLQEALESFSG